MNIGIWDTWGKQQRTPEFDSINTEIVISSQLSTTDKQKLVVGEALSQQENMLLAHWLTTTYISL